jgi:hypothetical protein
VDKEGKRLEIVYKQAELDFIEKKVEHLLHKRQQMVNLRKFMFSRIEIRRTAYFRCWSWTTEKKQDDDKQQQKTHAHVNHDRP